MGGGFQVQAWDQNWEAKNDKSEALHLSIDFGQHLLVCHFIGVHDHNDICHGPVADAKRCSYDYCEPCALCLSHDDDCLADRLHADSESSGNYYVGGCWVTRRFENDTPSLFSPWYVHHLGL